MKKAVKRVFILGNLNLVEKFEAVIRRPEIDDLEDLNELSKKSWLKGFQDILSEHELDRAQEKEDFITEESLKQNLESDGCRSLIFEENGKVVGKVRLAWTEEEMHDIAEPCKNEVQLRSFYVHPDQWRQGIGSRLLEKIIEEAPEWAETLKVEALENSDAVKFYRKNGFKRVESGTFSAEDTELVEKDYPTVIMKRKI